MHDLPVKFYISSSWLVTNGTSLFNAMILHKYTPDHFKKVLRLIVFKGGDRDAAMCENHKDITLLSTFGKL